MKPSSTAYVFLVALVIFVVSDPIKAGRVLHEKDRLIDVKSGNMLVFQSLPRGPVPPAGPSGCTYIPGSHGPPCP
ncbi:hypothetical protein Ccrd_006667 [Cynara cardunculus var. scolymus]|uniref:Transmembrane protein n=1 Tax=Cynara cardunculus var. scolymus TaxID=59895 RepID=A0A103XIL5_CYNCS|nr:hypothetical protein Ccrd_006667 [Cynara cardunculus var. scolymus]